MNTNETPSNDALDNIDPERRGFITKILAGAVALPAMTSVALGGPQQDGKGKGKGGKGKGAQGAKGKGKGGNNGNQNGRGGRQGQDRDPAETAARWIREFDKDGDGKLNERELTAALKTMQERRASGDNGGRGKGKGDGAGKGKGNGVGKGKGKGNGDAGIGSQGVTPKRPGG